MKIYEYVIPTPTTIKNRNGKLNKTRNFPFLNVLMVQSPISRNQCKKHWVAATEKIIAETGKPESPIANWYCHCIWHVSYKMDASNVTAGLKHVEDAMVKSGVIIGDRLSQSAQPFPIISEFVKSKIEEKYLVIRYSDEPFFTITSSEIN